MQCASQHSLVIVMILCSGFTFALWTKHQFVWNVLLWPPQHSKARSRPLKIASHLQIPLNIAHRRDAWVAKENSIHLLTLTWSPSKWYSCHLPGMEYGWSTAALLSSYRDGTTVTFTYSEWSKLIINTRWRWRYCCTKKNIVHDFAISGGGGGFFSLSFLSMQQDSSL